MAKKEHAHHQASANNQTADQNRSSADTIHQYAAGQAEDDTRQRGRHDHACNFSRPHLPAVADKNHNGDEIDPVGKRSWNKDTNKPPKGAQLKQPYDRSVDRLILPHNARLKYICSKNSAKKIRAGRK